MPAKKVFLSYAWEDDDYRLWVKRLATRLREDGVEARLDAWHCRPTDDIPSFMNREVRNADWVLVLCSPAYRAKVHAAEEGLRISGAAWEAQLLGNRMFALSENKALIVLALGAKEAAIPDFLIGKIYFDLSRIATFETLYRRLLLAIIGTSQPLASLPSLPDGLESEPVEPLRGRLPPASDLRIHAAEEAAYRDLVAETCDRQSLAGWATGSRQGSTARKILHLPDIYIPPLLTIQSLASGWRRRYSTASKKLEKQPALEVPALQDKILLLGGPGAGKSTFLYYLAYCLAKDPEPLAKWPSDWASALPVLVSLRQLSLWVKTASYASPDQLLWQYILSRIENEEIKIFLRACFGEKTVPMFLLLDGWDDVEESERKTVGEIIKDFSTVRPSCRFIITSRDLNGLGEDIREWPVFELSPFDNDQRSRFLDAWKTKILPLLGREEAEHQFALLEHECREPGIQQLAENPLLLSLIAWIYTEKGQLPRARSLVLGEVVDLLLWDWEDSKEADDESEPLLASLLKPGIPKERLRKCLDRIAFEAQDASAREGMEKPRSVQEGVARQILSEAHPHQSYEWAGEILLAMEKRTGLISFAEGSVSLPHKTLQEYMAGVHLARLKNFGQEVAPLSRQWTFWSEPIRLAVNHLSYSEEEQEKPLILVDMLLEDPSSEPEQVVQAGELTVELDLEKACKLPWCKQRVDRARLRIATLIENGALSARKRADLGDNLGVLGDPRFELESPYLPAFFQNQKEPLRGFVQIAPELPPGPIPYPYWMGRYPVTVGQFSAFMDDLGYDSPEIWLPIGWRWRQVTPATKFDSQDPDRWLRELLDLRSGGRRDRPRDWEEQRLYPNRALGGVSWFEAMAYASWLDARLRDAYFIPAGYCVRLPTETEWEQAACLGEQRTYPWGEDAGVEERANVVTLKSEREEAARHQASIGHASTVGIYPLGASKSGLLDLAGNVEEWTLSRYNGGNPIEPVTKEPRVLRGGSFQADALEARCSARQFDYPHASEVRQGLRVVLSVPIEDAV